MAEKSKWGENYNAIVKLELPVEGNKIWKFALEEHTTKGTMQMNVRKFQIAKEEGGYEGPTKNGFIEQIKSLEDVEKLEKMFAEYFIEVKKML